MSQHTYTDPPRPRYDSEAERAGNKLKDNEARIASLERRPAGGGDPGPWHEYASAALGGTWTNIDEADPFKWRRKRNSTGSLDDIGLEFSGDIVGGTSGSTIITFGTGDRFSKDKERIPIGVRVDGVALMGHAKIIASTGVMTIDFPIAAAPGGAPGGTAGGVLSGSYPSPGFAVDMATQAELDAAKGIEASKNSTDVTAARRNRINFIEGSNVTLTVADDAAGDEVEVTIASTGGGGGGGVSYRKTNQKQAVNTTTETDLLNGEITVAAGAMSATGLLRLTAYGTCFQNSGSDRAFARLRLKHGGTTIFDFAPGGTPWANNGNVSAWWLEAFIANSGATNTQNSGFKFLHEIISNSANGGLMTAGIGDWHVNTASGGVAHMIAIASNTGTKDTTATQTIEFTCALPVADANVWMKLYGALVEVI